jgi:hypothetical protein
MSRLSVRTGPVATLLSDCIMCLRLIELVRLRVVRCALSIHPSIRYLLVRTFVSSSKLVKADLNRPRNVDALYL